MTRAVDLQSCFVAEKAGERVVDGGWEFREGDFWALLRTLINAVQEQKLQRKGWRCIIQADSVKIIHYAPNQPDKGLHAEATTKWGYGLVV